MTCTGMQGLSRCRHASYLEVSDVCMGQRELVHAGSLSHQGAIHVLTLPEVWALIYLCARCRPTSASTRMAAASWRRSWRPALWRLGPKCRAPPMALPKPQALAAGIVAAGPKMQGTTNVPA